MFIFLIIIIIVTFKFYIKQINSFNKKNELIEIQIDFWILHFKKKEEKLKEINKSI